jgi:hypothetical protein
MGLYEFKDAQINFLPFIKVSGEKRLSFIASKQKAMAKILKSAQATTAA